MSANETGDRGESSPHRPVVTLAALYGAGGSVVGPRVAERLGVKFLDREIPEDVARRTGLSEEDVGAVDYKPRGRTERFAETLGWASNVTGDAAGSNERPGLQEHQLRTYIEDFLARSSASGGVTIGRGGMVVLADVPWALHVYLGGPRNARIEQRMSLEGIDRETAEQRQGAEDRARVRYVSRAYGVDGRDPSLYHLMIDSTALDLDTCVELIVTASRTRTRQADAGSKGQKPDPPT